ncbi:MAG TPA: helix-turn-helix domain-containing protein [Tahibacter sp.]|uniref:GlxA family transcriptional regulator n=1 Tax=Tahibacter sp. TaxID=2056211 RepID=UPI002CA3FA41|nr:helix-turn-helix domain-containing protein [Tahibacter sp.]HSX59269.1 helix-turn-helix domain-containing protein [Tahibacter sp.]
MNRAAARTIPVWAVVPPRCLLLDLAGPTEVLRRANLEQDELRFDLRYVAARRQLPSSSGLQLAALGALPARLPEDAVVLVSGSVDDVQFAPMPPRRDDEADEARIVDWLRATLRPSHQLLSICSGALLAARAGLLDGRACTTHFGLLDALRSLAPDARVCDNRLFVEDGNCWTSAGVTAGVDLLLHWLSRLAGPACTAAVARQLVIYLRRSGSDPQLSPWLEGRNHIHPAVHRAQDAVAAAPQQDWNLAALARQANTSPRHLSRLFNEHAGMSVPDYVNRLRVSLARELLQSTRLDMERVAERSGFASARQLRRAWARSNAAPPQQARHRD